MRERERGERRRNEGVETFKRAAHVDRVQVVEFVPRITKKNVSVLAADFSRISIEVKCIFTLVETRRQEWIGAKDFFYTRK